MSKLSFTIRELLLVTAIASMTLGWSLDHRRLAGELQSLGVKHASLKQEATNLAQRIAQMTVGNRRLQAQNDSVAAENVELKRRHDLFSRDEDVERLKIRFGPSLLRGPTTAPID
jgi:hypothetical protein